MNRLQPVYTEKAECQDCFKCVRQCPVKAIKVERGSAEVVPALCLSCGHCVTVCPVGAKRVRADLDRVRELIAQRKQVLVSLAPSYVTEFCGVSPGRLAGALRLLGFWGVSETALGAELVSARVARMLQDDPAPRLLLSSACPSAVELLRKYYPDLVPGLTDVVSPVLAHCRWLRQQYGAGIAIVFIGPCVAKKLDADDHPELLDAAITFRHLREWLASAGLEGSLATAEPAEFIPCRAGNGALYPVEGGMIAGIRGQASVVDAGALTISGVGRIMDALKGLRGAPLRQPLFVELLACEGGCINGPQSSTPGQSIIKRQHVVQTAGDRPAALEGPAPALDATVAAAGIRVERYTDAELSAALRRVGKRVPRDELNCSGCGYEDCRAFARALLDGKAEPAMCVSHLRKLAQNKASALLHAMPAGVLIVDDALRVVECNRTLATMLGEDAVLAYDAKPGLEGVDLDKLLPLGRLIEGVLHGAPDAWERDVRVAGRVFHMTLFAIEPHRLAGAILADVTQPAVRRQQVIRQAEEVIRKNLATVQQIAYLLGENAAESEATLQSIIRSFEPPAEEPAEPRHG